MIKSFHALLKQHIVEAIASSVRSLRARSRCPKNRKSGAITPLRAQRRRAEYREWSNATEHCRGCEAGSTRCLQENVKSYSLPEKQASARLLWLTRSYEASLRIEAFG